MGINEDGLIHETEALFGNYRAKLSNSVAKPGLDSGCPSANHQGMVAEAPDQF
jgi:hypothetical protein